MSAEKLEIIRNALIALLGEASITPFDALADAANAHKEVGWDYSTKEDIADAIFAAVREDERDRLEAFIRESGIQYAETIFDWTKMRREQGNA